MGWSFFLATDRDPERATWLSRQFSDELTAEGCLGSFLNAEEAEILHVGWSSGPDDWPSRDPTAFIGIFERLRARLREENERLPIRHFLWTVDANGERWSGSTTIILPSGAIELVESGQVMLRLDGGHGDPTHRHELKRSRIRIDETIVGKVHEEIRPHLPPGGPPPEESGFLLPYPSRWGDPLVEEPDGWLAVEPVLQVLGERIEVESLDAFARLSPDLDAAISFCRHAKAEGLPLFWDGG